jgi:hypothetical protein
MTDPMPSGMRTHPHPLLRNASVAAALAGMLLGALDAHAIEPAFSPNATVQTASIKYGAGLRRATEDELRSIHAQGFTDPLFERIMRYVSRGNAIEMLGDIATLLNPPLAWLPREMTFKDVVFNPANPFAVVDGSGAVLIQSQTSIKEVRVDRISMHGPSYGSVLIRDIDLRGSVAAIMRRN